MTRPLDAAGRPPLPGQLVVPHGEVVGELIDPGSLEHVALEIAARQRARLTREDYAGVYRQFTRFLGPHARPDELTGTSVRAYRDRLESLGRAPATIAKHLAALRTLASALGADPQIQTVRSARVQRGEPRGLTRDELDRLLLMPDRRRHAGRRDFAILLLLADAGLRRVEVTTLTHTAIIERHRYNDPRVRTAVQSSTRYAVRLIGKRGRMREVPLTERTASALRTWLEVRPAAETDRLLVSLPAVAGRQPAPLDRRDVGRIVERHATRAGLQPEQRGAHVLRHTFGTHLRDRGVPIDVIRELMGHEDIRTTQIYSAVNRQQITDAIDSADQTGPRWR